VHETARPASLDRLASGLAPRAWPRRISYRQLNLLFTFTYLFVSHAQPDVDRLRTNRQTNTRNVGPTPIVIGEHRITHAHTRIHVKVYCRLKVEGLNQHGLLQRRRVSDTNNVISVC